MIAFELKNFMLEFEHKLNLTRKRVLNLNLVLS